MTRIGVRPPLQITTMGPVSEAEIDEAAWVIEPVLSRREASLDMELGDYVLLAQIPTAARSWKPGCPSKCPTGGRPLIGVAEAAQRLASSGGRYLVFVGCATGRGNVIYRRYDGHYGRITPVADEGG